MSDEVWISTGEAADRLGVSKDTVRRWVDEKILRGKWTQPGNHGHRKVSLASVEEHLRATDPDRDNAR